ncbi:MAG: hypothetical protein IKZ45_03320 [Fibrobacter sp.]|nr:hypothetical protein [Fibrobacter sp.]
MKNLKISLLAAGATLVLLACSSLEVDNPTEENFPKDWSVSEYLKVNPELRALQIMDQVAIWNATKGFESDEEAFLKDTTLMTNIALNYAGFTEKGLDFADKDKMKYLKAFNMYGVDNEPEVFATLALDTAAIEMQFIAYGAIEGRPYRACATTDANLVKKGDCQSAEAASAGYVGHLYCAKEGVTYCLDCDAVADECPEVVTEESSSSATAPASSDAAGDASSSSEGEGGEADSSSSEGGENPESSDATADSSSSEEAAAESSSSAE